MILNIRVVPRSSSKLIKKEGAYLKVYLTRPAQDGLANAQLIHSATNPNACHWGIRAVSPKGLKKRGVCRSQYQH